MATEGTCPVCERAIRVRSGKMVHHGFTRPGRGHLVGDCYGVACAPYEVSCDGTRGYRDNVVAPRLWKAKEFLARLEGDHVEVLHYEERVPVPTTAPHDAFARRSPGWTTWWLPARRDETAPDRQHVWRRVFAERLSDTRSDLRVLEPELARCERLIRDWRPGELREVARDPPAAEPPGHRRRPFARRR